MSYSHIPVLADAILEHLVPEEGVCRVVDGTVGYGGHSSLILRKNRQAELLGIDRDSEALSSAQDKLHFASDRVHLIRGKFGDLATHVEEAGWASVNMILLDIGVSSPQLDNPLRGFSFRQDGPLDMRMDKRSPNTASRLLNKLPEEELADIFYLYGEIGKSRRLARKIVERREKQPFTRTKEFAELCEDVLGKARPGKLPTPTTCFQALRIAVNGELDELISALDQGKQLLAPKGRIGVISFHSLEDRIVKNFFRKEASDCICPPGLPVCVCEHKASLKIITKRPIVADQEELQANPRAACAKLRVAEKMG